MARSTLFDAISAAAAQMAHNATTDDVRKDESAKTASYFGGEISIYVGTYRKYNEGDTGGAWINMEVVKDVDDFYRVCRSVHKDEKDPEFMFPDYQGFPEWFYGESMGPEEIGEIIKYAHATPEERARMACEDEGADGAEEPTAPAFTIVDYSEKAIAVTGDTKAFASQLKALGGRPNRHLSCGPGWIFPKRKREQVEAVLRGSRVDTDKAAPKTPKMDDKALLDEYLQEMAKVDGNSKSMMDYHEKCFSSAVRLENGGLVVFEKPRIETSFCFGYSDCGQGQTFDEACKAEEAANSESYFLNRNLSDFDERLEALRCNCKFADDDPHPNYYCAKWYIVRGSYGGKELNLYNFSAIHHWQEGDCRDMMSRATPMSDADRNTIIDGLQHERDKFEKRLHAYLKRYGTSKLHTWTYWRDE